MESSGYKVIHWPINEILFGLDYSRQHPCQAFVKFV